jgi:hypothetical protein
MKKVIVLSIAVLAAMALALPANADLASFTANDKDTMLVTLGSGSNGDRPVNTYGLSNNVYLYYVTDQDGTHMNYVIGSVHKSGNRAFASANATTLIYYQSKDTGVTTCNDVTQIAPATSVSFPSGTWTAL